MIKVLTSGLLTSIQDRGRFGYRSLGVPVSGAMDLISSAYANRLLGNPIDAGVLEFAMLGPSLEFMEKTHIVVCGASFQPSIDGKEFALGKIQIVKKGSILKLGSPRTHMYGYLAVTGGFDQKEVMGSMSMYAGITTPSSVAKGDRLQLKKNISILGIEGEVEGFHLASSPTIEVYPGPEWRHLSREMQKTVVDSEFQIHHNSNRMACLLDHELSIEAAEIITSGVQPGTVQLTPSGKAIVLMRDAQTTGGYARILQLSDRAINHLAQKRPGEPIEFKLIL